MTDGGRSAGPGAGAGEPGPGRAGGGAAGVRPGLAHFLQAVVEAAQDAVLAVSPDRRVLAVNRRFADLWGLSPDRLGPGAPSPALGAEQRSLVRDPEAFEAALVWGHRHPDQAQTLEVELVDGRLVVGYAAPILDPDGTYLGRVWYMHDETARRSFERQREELLEQLEAAQASQRFLLEASNALAHASGFAETIGSLAQVAVPTLGDLCLIDVIDDRDRITRMAAVHVDPAQRARAERLRDYPPDPAGSHPSALAIRDRRSRYSDRMPEEFLRSTSQDRAHLAILHELCFTSYMAVPLVAEDQVLGALTLVSAGSGRRFGRPDLALAEQLARHVALVVAKERRYDAERRASHTFQTSLLPRRLPVVPGTEIAVRYLPGTRDAEVGGDFWDVATMPTGEIALAVGDVAGHDITAAATMAQLRSAYRALRAHTTGPAQLIERVQAVWDSLDLHRMATSVFARLAPSTGTLRVASAGHPPPVVIEDGAARLADLVPTTPFGAPARPVVSWQHTLGPGGVVVLYTDGLVEDRDRPLDEGMGRLVDVAGSGAALGPERLADHLLAGLSSEDRADDIALLILRRSAVGR